MKSVWFETAKTKEFTPLTDNAETDVLIIGVGMVREIHERIVCGARFQFLKDGKVLFDEYSENANFEWVNGQ